MNNSSQSRIFFYALLGLSLVAGFLLLRPYLGVIALALITVIIFRPVYVFLYRRLQRRRGLATGLTLLLLLLVVLGPLAVIAQRLQAQVVLFQDDVAVFLDNPERLFDAFVGQINVLLESLPFFQAIEITDQSMAAMLREYSGTLSTAVGTYLGNALVSIGTSSLDSIISIVLFFVLLAVMFPSFPRDVQMLKRISPLSDDLDQLYIDKLSVMAKAMVRGVFVIALAQGLTQGVLYWIAGVPYLFFLTLLSIIAAMLPLGAGIIAIPVGLVLLALGQYWQAGLVIGGYLIFVNQIDNVLRPMLVSKEAYLNPALLLLSAFGGLNLFGLLGVIYGPMVMIFITTTFEIYLEYYLPNKSTLPTRAAATSVPAVLPAVSPANGEGPAAPAAATAPPASPARPRDPGAA